MNKIVKNLFQEGKNNREFLLKIEKADRDKAPGVFASEIEKHIFAAYYYGWLVAKGRFKKENYK